MSRRVVAIALVWLTLSGCATSRFQAHVANGRWTEAAEAFAADTALQVKPDALFAAGVLFATPGRPTYDPERARGLLRRLTADYPRTAQARDAAVLLPLLDQVLTLREELRQLKEIDLRPPEGSGTP